jgi:hypothetical protein
MDFDRTALLCYTDKTPGAVHKHVEIQPEPRHLFLFQIYPTSKYYSDCLECHIVLVAFSGSQAGKRFSGTAHSQTIRHTVDIVEIRGDQIDLQHGLIVEAVRFQVFHIGARHVGGRPR